VKLTVALKYNLEIRGRTDVILSLGIEVNHRKNIVIKDVA
jgi:hypothetical protein